MSHLRHYHVQMSTATPHSDELEQTLGRRVRDLRMAQRLTQTEVAERANISTGALKHLEAGSGATIRTLVRVLRALGEEDWVETLGPPAPVFNPLELLDARRREQARPTARRVRRPTRTTP